jgi:hypothetical protein
MRKQGKVTSYLTSQMSSKKKTTTTMDYLQSHLTLKKIFLREMTNQTLQNKLKISTKGKMVRKISRVPDHNQLQKNTTTQL